MVAGSGAMDCYCTVTYIHKRELVPNYTYLPYAVRYAPTVA